MNRVGSPCVGQWYARWDTGEIFQVVDVQHGACTIDREMFGGDVEVIDEDTWASLPLAWAEPPPDWTEPHTQVTVSVVEWIEPVIG